jgi:RNA polymerase sigma factor (sigma-70 family)
MLGLQPVSRFESRGVPPPPAPRERSAPRYIARVSPEEPRQRSASLYDDQTDAELIARCRDGQQGAWATLVRRYQRLLYTVALRAGLAEDHAAEVFQASFVRLYEHLHKLREPEHLRAWLVTTTKREVLLLRERLSRHVHLQGEDGEASDAGAFIEQMPDGDPLPEARLSELQQWHRVRLAVEKLDARSQRWVELLFLQEEPLPYNEVAVLMQVPIGSIGPTRARVLAKLRTLMESL